MDGLGRLTASTENVNGTIRKYIHSYDRLSQLTESEKLDGSDTTLWNNGYVYHEDGNLDYRRDLTEDPVVDTNFTYTGNLLTNFDGSNLTWDNNGSLTGATTTIENNYDNRLRQATRGTYTMDVKYAPDGDRVYRKITNGQTVEHERYYVVDNAGKYSQILLEIEPGETPQDDDTIEKTYIYAHNQVLAQIDGPQFVESPTPPTPRYYYLHDRLGSVRMLIDDTGAVQNYYTYDPFGTLFDNEYSVTIENHYLFAGYWWDDEIDQYYCRARMYEPELQRFTSIDPVRGGFTEPLTLHQYLYCLNNPVNRIDPDCNFSILGVLSSTGIRGMIESSKCYSDVLHSVSTFAHYVNSMNIVKGSLYNHVNMENFDKFVLTLREIELVSAAVGFGAAAYGGYKVLSKGYRLLKGLKSSAKFVNAIPFEKATRDGIERIEQHLAKLGALDDPANAAMLKRLREGNIGETELRFYQHELLEMEIITDYSYEGARAAHLEVLEMQGIPYEKGYEKMLYGDDIYNDYLK